MLVPRSTEWIFMTGMKVLGHLLHERKVMCTKLVKKKCVFAWALHKNAWRWIQNPPFHRWCWVLEPQISDCLHYWSIPGIPCMKTWTWMFCSVFGGLILRCFDLIFCRQISGWKMSPRKRHTFCIIFCIILHRFLVWKCLKQSILVAVTWDLSRGWKLCSSKTPCNSPWSDSAHSCIGRSPTGTFVDLSGNSGRQVLAFCEVGIIVQPNCMHSLGILGMGVAAAARRISNFRFVLQYLQWQEWGAFQSGSQCPKVPRCAKTLVTLDISWQSACWFFPIEHDSTHSKICYVLFSVALVEVLRTNCLDWIVSNWNQFPGVFLSDLLNRLPVLYKIGQWTSASS